MTQAKKALPPSRWGSPYYLKWCFTVRDFAQAVGLSEQLIRQAIRNGELDPTSINGVAEFIALRDRKDCYQFTYADLAKATGRALATVRSALRIRRNNVHDVARFVIQSAIAESVRFSHHEIAELLGNDAAEIARWDVRWPKFDLYHCGVANCASILIEAGLCPQHGGAPQPLITVKDQHFLVYLSGEYVPICHLILGVATPSATVKHLDGNHWNSRLDNLEIISGMKSRRAQWSFGYRELAAVLDLSEDSVRQAVARGSFDPGSLSSLTSFWYLRGLEDEKK